MRRKTNQDFVRQVKNLVGNEYSFLDSYNGARVKIKVRHNTCGRIFLITPDNFLRGRRCSHCSHIRIQHRKSVTWA